MSSASSPVPKTSTRLRASALVPICRSAPTQPFNGPGSAGNGIPPGLRRAAGYWPYTFEIGDPMMDRQREFAEALMEYSPSEEFVIPSLPDIRKRKLEGVYWGIC